MWCNIQGPPVMGLQPTNNKRKLEEDFVHPTTKVGRIESWDQDVLRTDYLPADKTNQWYSPVGFYGGSSAVYRPHEVQQQTIRCEENGKSYLDLGSWTGNNVNGKCCEGRTSWCSRRGPSCYRQKRLTVLNISMCKLGRYRQFSDPSLHRSVLICNTLRLIEKEMEQEGYFSSHPNTSLPSEQSHSQTCELTVPHEPPRSATPFPPSASNIDSSLGDERSINWGSVLSLSSQSDLDPLNNNDCFGDTELSQELDDFLPSWKLTTDDIFNPVPPRTSESGDIENIMHVLVGT